MMIAPFPYFGGKSRIAAEVWARFGDVPNYIEPFFGSGAVLLGRPHVPRLETVNDADGYIVNFWRAVKADPEAVAQWADWPVNENDLQARHYWLVSKGRERLAQVLGDPFGYDTQVAGWWLWGICIWIGGGWCSDDGPWQWQNGEWRKRDRNSIGICRKRPHLGTAGQGITRGLPRLGDGGTGLNRQLPPSTQRADYIRSTMVDLAARLRNVRVCCGDWNRICGPSPTIHNGLTAVFLDPPYSRELRHGDIYLVERNAASEVHAWALAHGDDPLLRIAICGYESEGADNYPSSSWECLAWKSSGGYGSQGNGRGRENCHRERIWFSPHCLKRKQGELFGGNGR